MAGFSIEDEYDLIEKISFVACGIEILVQKKRNLQVQTISLAVNERTITGVCR